jgi:hypothetical protein
MLPRVPCCQLMEFSFNAFDFGEYPALRFSYASNSTRDTWFCVVLVGVADDPGGAPDTTRPPAAFPDAAASCLNSPTSSNIA